MLRRGEITAEVWEQIAPFLSENGRPGGRWKTQRPGPRRYPVEGTHRCPCRDPPSRYDPWQTCYDRFVRWRCYGTLDRLVARVQTKKSDAVGDVE